ncbi:winged helix DNA-binding domain-containing protein [Nonomuraea sp. NPDC050328]|uniref:winged helix DNA-binding domain-containing protein n=1 Tax=Nonomuraea sp. NPDC050328 TaxID=3364361 RepID=UPI00378BFC9C
MNFSWSQVSARRLARHHLSAPAEGLPLAEVVRRMGSTHAQVMSAAELGLGLRSKGATRQSVREALWQERSLVKTFGPRGTVHLLPAEDLPVWLGALSALPSATAATPEMRMPAEQVEAVIAAIGEALDGQELTVDELDAEVVARTGPWAGDLVMPAFQGWWPRWRQVISVAAHRGVLAFGAGRGRKVTYVNPRIEPAPADSSLEQVATWFLHAFGPATPERFAHFMNAPKPLGRAVFDRLDLEAVTVEGRPAVVARGDLWVPDEPPSGVLLLPYFDYYSYAVGNDKELLHPGPAAERVMGKNFQTLIVDGVVAGLWHQKRSGSRLAVTVEALTAVDLDLLEEQVIRVGEIMEARPTLTLGPVTVGGHA